MHIVPLTDRIKRSLSAARTKISSSIATLEKSNADNEKYCRALVVWKASLKRVCNDAHLSNQNALHKICLEIIISLDSMKESSSSLIKSYSNTLIHWVDHVFIFYNTINDYFSRNDLTGGAGTEIDSINEIIDIEIEKLLTPTPTASWDEIKSCLFSQGKFNKTEKQVEHSGDEILLITIGKAMESLESLFNKWTPGKKKSLFNQFESEYLKLVENIIRISKRYKLTTIFDLVTSLKMDLINRKESQATLSKRQADSYLKWIVELFSFLSHGDEKELANSKLLMLPSGSRVHTVASQDHVEPVAMSAGIQQCVSMNDNNVMFDSKVEFPDNSTMGIVEANNASATHAKPGFNFDKFSTELLHIDEASPDLIPVSDKPKSKSLKDKRPPSRAVDSKKTKSSDGFNFDRFSSKLDNIDTKNNSNNAFDTPLSEGEAFDFDAHASDFGVEEVVEDEYDEPQDFNMEQLSSTIKRDIKKSSGADEKSVASAPYVDGNSIDKFPVDKFIAEEFAVKDELLAELNTLEREDKFLSDNISLDNASRDNTSRDNTLRANGTNDSDSNKEELDSDATSIIVILQEEIADLFNEIKVLISTLIDNTNNDHEKKKASTQYIKLLSRFSLTCEELNLAGLNKVCDMIRFNFLKVTETKKLNEKALRNFKDWPQIVLKYLVSPSNVESCITLISFLQDADWPKPLNDAKAKELLKELSTKLEIPNFDEDASVRETHATVDDVSLAVNENASQELISAFFVESPNVASKLSTSIEEISRKNEVAENIKAAQRYAHTLKGSASLLGVNGVSNLTHHLEDILEYFALNPGNIPQPLLVVIQDATDCVESMLESMQAFEEAPENSLEILQSVLHWANKIDCGDIETKSEAAESPESPESLESLDKLTVKADRPQSEVKDKVSSAKWLVDNDQAMVAADSQQETLKQDNVLKADIKLFSLSAKLDKFESTQDTSNSDELNDFLEKSSSKSSKSSKSIKSKKTKLDQIKPVQIKVEKAEIKQVSTNKQQQLATATDEAQVSFSQKEKITAKSVDTKLSANASNIISKKSSKENISVIKSDVKLAKKYGVALTDQDRIFPSLRTALATNQSNIAPSKSNKSMSVTKEESLYVPVRVIDDMFKMIGEMAIKSNQINEFLNNIKVQKGDLDQQNKSFQRHRSELEELVNVQRFSHLQNAETQGGQNIETDENFDSLEMDQYDELHGSINCVIETVLDSSEIQHNIQKQINELQEVIKDQQQLNSELQQIVLNARVISVQTIVPKLQRTVRQTCRATNKEVNLEIEGKDLMLDSDILNNLADPLIHMLRNSIDHGIESKAKRLAEGKPASGLIRLSFKQVGNEIEVICADDGAGLDYDKITKSAINKNLINSCESIRKTELANLILAPGFTTREHATKISGRGIGMDIVANLVRSYGGHISISDNEPSGCKIKINLPIKLVTTHTLLIGNGKELYAIPSSSIHQVKISEPGDYQVTDGIATFNDGDEVYPASFLSALVSKSEFGGPNHNEPKAALLVKNDNGDINAILVDQVYNGVKLVIKAPSRFVPRLPGLSGVSILGNGSIVPVMDLKELLRRPVLNRKMGYHDFEANSVAVVEPELKVLIVDDSISVRKSLTELIEDVGYEVFIARNGVEALDVMRKNEPDIILTDLEMPKMNGLELTTNIRADKTFKDIPIIMITSRASQKHRLQAEKVGVNKYLTKPYTENDLLDVVESFSIKK